jgi:prepilin-type N-terminal cleavage/methylation domain-containing protein
MSKRERMTSRLGATGQGCSEPWPVRARHAFTLIELLAVISIIALLISITIPALGSARETSRRAKCLANLRGMGQGLALYMNDSKDLFPMVRPMHDPGGNQNDPSLLDILADYVDAPLPRRESDDDSFFIVSDPFLCPSDLPNSQDGEPLWRTAGVSYEYMPGLFMLGAELLAVRDPQKGVSMAYQKNRKWPILMDHEPWHKLRAGIQKNAVYWDDYHADWGAEPWSDSTVAGLMMEDVIRFGGGIDPGGGGIDPGGRR